MKQNNCLYINSYWAIIILDVSSLFDALYFSFLTNLLHFIYYPFILLQSWTSQTSSAYPGPLSNLPVSSTLLQENKMCTFAPNLTVPIPPGTTAPVLSLSTVPVSEPTTAESSLEKLHKPLSMKCLHFPPQWSPCFMTEPILN